MNKDETIHIIYGSDENYIEPTFVSAASLIVGNVRPCHLIIHLLDTGVEDASWDKFCSRLRSFGTDIEFVRHKIDNDRLKGLTAYKGSVATYARMFVAEIVLDVEWAVYVDGDTLWVGDICDLLQYRDEAKIIVGAIDPSDPYRDSDVEFRWFKDNGLQVDPREYVNVGLMLVNLRLMRELEIPQKCRDFLFRVQKPRFADQTVLNYVCRGKIGKLPPQWGVFSFCHNGVDITNGALIHYACDVPWKRTKVTHLFSDVVMLWFYFCKIALNENYLEKYYNRGTFLWRRGLFLVFKWLHPLIKLSGYLNSKLRNVCGLKKDEISRICERFEKQPENGR